MPRPLPAGSLILLEDNHAVRVATELFLNLEGYRTRSVATVAEAERLFEAIAELVSPAAAAAPSG